MNRGQERNERPESWKPAGASMKIDSLKKKKNLAFLQNVRIYIEGVDREGEKHNSHKALSALMGLA